MHGDRARSSNRTRLFRLVPVFAALAILAAAGCAQTSVLRSSDLKPLTAPVRVLVMPPDVELSELTAGGLLEPKADWTQQARSHVIAALREELQAKGTPVVYQPPTNDPGEETAYTHFVKLHDAVGGAILVHKYLFVHRLPTKEGKFDWSLGHRVGRLRERTGADYALFVFLRDSYASPGRVALIVGAALLGVGIPGGQQYGFASLVDLRTGDVIWFNRLVDPGGDLRTPEPARKAIKTLLTDLPQ